MVYEKQLCTKQIVLYGNFEKIYSYNPPVHLLMGASLFSGSGWIEGTQDSSFFIYIQMNPYLPFGCGEPIKSTVYQCMLRAYPHVNLSKGSY